MRNWLGQEIDVDSWVYRGSGTSGGGTQVQVGKVLRFSGKYNHPRVQWKYSPGYKGIFSRTESESSVPVDQLYLIDGDTKTRIDVTEAITARFTAMNREPSRLEFMQDIDTTQPNWYYSPEYKQALEDLEKATAEWNQGLKNEIQQALAALGL